MNVMTGTESTENADFCRQQSAFSYLQYQSVACRDDGLSYFQCCERKQPSREQKISSSGSPGVSRVVNSD